MENKCKCKCHQTMSPHLNCNGCIDILELLAEIEHNQWVEWSKSLVSSEKRISFARIERWKKLWKPYSELTEEEKEQDRVYVRKVFKIIESVV